MSLELSVLMEFRWQRLATLMPKINNLTRFLRVLFFLVFVFYGHPCSSGQREYKQATYLDDGDRVSTAFDPALITHFYFCFETEGKVLIGEKSAWNWEYDPRKMYVLRGKMVSLRYDKKHIWVIATDGKEMKLKQDYLYDVFKNAQCRSAIKTTPSKNP